MSRILLLSFICLFFGALTAQNTWTWDAKYKPSKVNDWLETDDLIYLATDAGIYLVDKQTGELTDHWTRISAGLPSNKIESIKLEPGTNRIFIGTYDIGIGFQTPEGTWETIPYPAEAYNEFNPLMTYCVNFDASGRLLAGTSEGIGRYDDGHWSWYGQGEIGPFVSGAWKMVRQDDGEVLIASNLLLRTNGDDFDILSPINPNGGFPDSLFAYGSAQLYRQSNGDIWFITDVGDVGRYDGHHWDITHGFQQTEIPFNHARFMTEDQEGALWLCVDYYGFVKYQDGDWVKGDVGMELSNPTAMIFGDGFSVGVTSDTIRWSGAQTESMTAMGNMPWPSYLYRLRNDQDGKLWTRPDAHLIQTMDGSQSIELQNDFVSDFGFAPDGTCWVVSSKKIIRIKDGVRTEYTPQNSNLPDQYSYYMSIDQGGRPWVNIYSKGIYAFNGQDWKLMPAVDADEYSVLEMKAAGADVAYTVLYKDLVSTLFKLSYSGTVEPIDWPAGWNGNSYSSMYSDPANGDLYVGGYTKQLIRWNGETWNYIDLPEGWPEEGPVRQIGIQNGNLWIRGSNQLAFREDGDWRFFDVQNSPMDSDPTLDAGIDQNGVAWILHSPARAVETLTTGWALVTGVTPHPAPASVRLFPNPTQDKLYIDGANGSGMVTILDAAGRIAGNWSTTELSQGLEVSALPAGIYRIRILQDGRAYIGSFAKE